MFGTLDRKHNGTAKKAAVGIISSARSNEDEEVKQKKKQKHDNYKFNLRHLQSVKMADATGIVTEQLIKRQMGTVGQAQASSQQTRFLFQAKVSFLVCGGIIARYDEICLH